MDTQIVIIIPTRVMTICPERRKYLGLTLLSVVRAIKRHGKSMRVVVSDTSPENEVNATRNLLGELQIQSRLVEIHYYSSVNWLPFISELFAQSTQIERDAIEYLIPPDGHWGADRNRLSLLAVRHGGSSVAYLHLDDDTPLPNPEGQALHGCLESAHDVLGIFAERFREAMRFGKIGYASGIDGIPDGFVSHSHSRGIKETEARGIAPQRKVLPFGLGPGRIMAFAGMKEPYRPYGRDEDVLHSRAFGKQPYLTDKTTSGSCELYVHHIGKQGVFRAAKRCFEYGFVPPRIRHGWRYLVERVAATWAD